MVEMWKERVRAFEAIVHTLHLMLTHAAINSDAVSESRTAAQARRLSSHIPPPYLRPLDPPPSLPAWTPRLGRAICSNPLTLAACVQALRSEATDLFLPEELSRARPHLLPITLCPPGHEVAPADSSFQPILSAPPGRF